MLEIKIEQLYREDYPKQFKSELEMSGEQDVNSRF